MPRAPTTAPRAVSGRAAHARESGDAASSSGNRSRASSRSGTHTGISSRTATVMGSWREIFSGPILETIGSVVPTAAMMASSASGAVTAITPPSASSSAIPWRTTISTISCGDRSPVSARAIIINRSRLCSGRTPSCSPPRSILTMSLPVARLGMVSRNGADRASSPKALAEVDDAAAEPALVRSHPNPRWTAVRSWAPTSGRRPSSSRVGTRRAGRSHARCVRIRFSWRRGKVSFPTIRVRGARGRPSQWSPS